jgi:hypothetical protein
MFDMLRSAVSLAIVTTLLASAPTTVHAAAPKSGAACSKVGASQSVKGVKYTCTKVGRKLVWKAAVPARPTSLTWNNYKLFNITIHEYVWNESLKLPRTAPFENPVRSIVVGPQTDLKGFDPKPSLERAEGLLSWAGPSIGHVFMYYGCADQEWANAEYSRRTQLAPDPRLDRACSGAGSIAWRTDSGPVHVNFYGPIGRIRGAEAFIEIHEFIHVLQWSQQKVANKQTLEDSIPTWLVEGQAQFLTALTVSDDTMFEYFMRGWRYQREKTTLAEINEWLACACTGTSDARNYQLGAQAALALSSIYGIRSTMNLIGDILNGATFEGAVLTIYGEPWATLRPKLAAYVYYLNNL